MGVDENDRENVILYPSPGMGHLLPMVEFARLLVGRNPLLDVTILVLNNTGTTRAFLSSVAATNPSISFDFLPPVDLSDLPSTVRFDESLFVLIHRSKPNVDDYMSASLHRHPLAFVVDDFCSVSAEAATRLGVPAYVFFTGCAAGLGAFLHLPTVHSLTTQSFKDMGDAPVNFPGIPPIPADHMPIALHDREDASYEGFLHLSRCIAEADGIIINTFDGLEGKTFRNLRTTGASDQPIYSVGPLIAPDGGRGREESGYFFKWLDMQPKGSVVFLCFGSMGTFSHHQLQEIATGLERTQHSFLWVVKNSDENSTLDSLLPQGFLDRTKDRGVVVESWVPQVAVLRHEAVGCFVTHLGWNSVLEAISAGVGMIGWPLYAEQKMNKVFVGDDMKLAIAMEGYGKEVVSAAEVERSVRKMMGESEDGAAVKERCSAMKLLAAETVGEGGASTRALDQLVKDWRVGRKSSKLLTDIVNYQF